MMTLAQRLNEALQSGDPFMLKVSFVDDRSEVFDAWLWNVGSDYIEVTWAADVTDSQLIPLSRFHSIAIEA
jgi:hypothetical protein